MTWSVDFAPFFSWTVIGLIAVPAAILAAGLVLSRRSRRSSSLSSIRLSCAKSAIL